LAYVAIDVASVSERPQRPQRKHRVRAMIPSGCVAADTAPAALRARSRRSKH